MQSSNFHCLSAGCSTSTLINVGKILKQTTDFTKLRILELAKLGKRMSVRQQALATAQIYLKRFYLKVEIRRTNPYLVMATALYLACKMEECPQHIRIVVSEARSTWPSKEHMLSSLQSCTNYLNRRVHCV